MGAFPRLLSSNDSETKASATNGRGASLILFLFQTARFTNGASNDLLNATIFTSAGSRKMMSRVSGSVIGTLPPTTPITESVSCWQQFDLCLLPSATNRKDVHLGHKCFGMCA